MVVPSRPKSEASGILGQSGATLVESLLAFTLFATLAASVYPLFIVTRETGKTGDFRQLCENTVNAKLEEYLGRTVNPTAEGIIGTSTEHLARLSVPSLTPSTVTRYSTQGALSQVGPASGFYYAKLRYNQHFPYACNAGGVEPSTAPILSLAPSEEKLLGMRECVGSNDAGRETQPPTCADIAQDNNVGSEIPGFKLYVKLERQTTWPFGAAGRDSRDDDRCPSFGRFRGGATDLYDFDAAGDSIRITVTGIADLPAQVQKFGTIPSSQYQRLRCSVTGVVQPSAQVIRYYVNSDGRVYPAHGTGLNGSEGNWTLGSLYQNNAMTSGIRSIAVHPRNLAVYVLRAGGYLYRYSNCGGVPFDCDLTSAMTGISDDGQTPWPSVQEFRLPASVTSVAIDFRTGTTYGMIGKSDLVSINVASGSGPVPLGRFNATIVTEGELAMPTLDAVHPLRPLVTGSTRLTSYFLDPGGAEAFVSDTSTSGVLGASLYGTTIYRATDSTWRSPLLTLPVTAMAISR